MLNNNKPFDIIMIEKPIDFSKIPPWKFWLIVAFFVFCCICKIFEV